MKIIITESQYIKLLESDDKYNVVEQILEMEGIKYDGCEYDGRNRDSFGRTHDSVVFYFEFPNDYKHRSIRFLTKNNKVVSVSSASDFRTIADGFRYIPKKILMDYFIEKGKTHLEKTLSDRYPDDNLKESVIKEDNLKTTLLHRIETEGWEDTSELVGGYENLIGIVGEDKIIDLLISCFSDLNVKKMGNDIILRDNHLPILEKPSSFWGLPLKVFNDNIEVRLEVKFGSDITKVYRNVRREFIRELVSRFPDLYTSDVNVYKDNGLYVKYDSFSLS